MNQEEFKTKLRELDLTEYESNILIYLISQKDYISAKEISKKSNVPMGRIYSILLELEKNNLIKKFPGKIAKYKIENKNQFIRSITKKNKKELEKKETQINNAANFLKLAFPQISNNKSSNFEINYFDDNNKYWQTYVNCVNKLKPGDKYRIINSLRLSDSFLYSELKNNPKLKQMINNDNKKIKNGIIFHMITNPKSVVQKTIEELENNETLIKESLNLLLKTYKMKSSYNRYITISDSFQSLIFVILKEDVFMEFYSEKTNNLTSAIHIKSKQIRNDLASWFDGFDKNKNHNPQKDYKIFETEIKKWALKSAQIKL